MKKFTTAFLIIASLYSLAVTPSAFAKNNIIKSGQKPQKLVIYKSAHTKSAQAQPNLVRHLSVGTIIQGLPKGRKLIRHNKRDYHYHNGTFYRSRADGRYIVIKPPIGLRVSYLPRGYTSVFIGPKHYFYSNSNYYLYDRSLTAYVVVKKPVGTRTTIIKTN